MEYPKALYLNGQQRLVDNPSQEDDAREDGYTDWHADAARAEAPAAPSLEQPGDQVDIEVLRETESRLAEWELQLRYRDEQLTGRENVLAAREEAVVAAEAVLAEKQAALVNLSPANAGAVEPLDREALKARATELDIEFPRNVTTEKLAELVAAADK